MPTSVRDVTTEIKAIILKGIEAGNVMPTQWITAAILLKHPVLYDPDEIGTTLCDSSFSELARHEFASDRVRRVLRLFKKPESDIPLMPGFLRLQSGYLTTSDTDVDADGDDNDERDHVIMPTPLMSDEQLLSKATAYDAIGEGAIEHAAEIRRYVAERNRTETARRA